LIIIYYGWSQNKAAILSIALLAAAVVLMMLITKLDRLFGITADLASAERYLDHAGHGKGSVRAS